MTLKTPASNTEELDLITRFVVTAADDKGAEELVILDMSEFSLIGDRFILATAKSRIHLKAIADEVRKVLRRETSHRVYLEGYDSPGWVLCECGGVVCHFFLRETRDFYSLERLWEDAPRMDVDSFFA